MFWDQKKKYFLNPRAIISPMIFLVVVFFQILTGVRIEPGTVWLEDAQPLCQALVVLVIISSSWRLQAT